MSNTQTINFHDISRRCTGGGRGRLDGGSERERTWDLRFDPWYGGMRMATCSLVPGYDDGNYMARMLDLAANLLIKPQRLNVVNLDEPQGCVFTCLHSRLKSGEILVV